MTKTFKANAAFLFHQPYIIYILYGINLSLMGMGIRFIGKSVPIFEKMFFANGLSLTFLSLFMYKTKLASPLTRQPIDQLFRAFLSFLAIATMFYALEFIPLALVTSIQFLYPLILTIIAGIFLKEKISLHRWLGILVGLVGIIIAFGFTLPQGLGPISALLSALFIALTALSAKKLSICNHPATTALWSASLLVVFSLASGAVSHDWILPSLYQWGWIIFMGFFLMLSQISLNLAVCGAQLSQLMPFDFLRLIWMSAIGFFFFGEDIRPHVILGGLIILASTTYTMLRETKVSLKT